MTKYHSLLFIIAGCFLTVACDTDVEKIEVQKPYTYSEQYYEQLRAFKKSAHEISYVYYADWAPVEGNTNMKNPASWNERIAGLPDSLDICNLWMGIPTPETQPVAYADMVECQRKKGTRFVFHADASHYNHAFYDRNDQFEYVVNPSTGSNRYYDLRQARTEEALKAYARWACDTVVKCGLDGVDFDYEGWTAADLMVVVKECDRFFGSSSQYADKLVIVDYFNTSPPVEIDNYCDYIVKQAYSGQGAGVGANGHADEKMVYCESFGQNPTGGQIWKYAAWEPADGRHKGGCGAFYVERNYFNTLNGVPYQAIREAIQIMNPAASISQ